MGYEHRIEAKDLLGLTIVEITKDDREINFTLSDGRVAKMYHDQDCCESVYIEEIVGDLQDLVGNPLLQAEEVSSTEPTPEVQAKRDAEKQKALLEDSYYYDYESETWTFYKFATIKGSVTIRWYGTSNGYYSERVDLELQ